MHLLTRLLRPPMWSMFMSTPPPSHPLNARLTRRTAGLALLSLLAAGCSTVPSVPVISESPLPAKPKKIGLALGGGAARGFAHVGVIQVLEEAGIRPDLVVGTSAGSLVAALYASGKTPAQLLQLSQSMDEATFADWQMPGLSRGLIKGEALARYVNQQVNQMPIEAMPMPLGMVATELKTGDPILFRRGDTGTAVRASSAVPAIFQPVTISGRDYVDGGLVSPVPVRFAKEMGAQFVIAVDISSPPEGATTDGSVQILLQTFSIMSKSINRFELLNAELVIRPNLTGIASSDFGSRVKSIQAGRAAMLAALPGLKAQLGRP